MSSKAKITIEGGKDSLGFYTRVIYRGRVQRTFRCPYVSEQCERASAYAEQMREARGWPATEIAWSLPG